jgi:glycosyltransferase involved in cell wall biosynthesis
MQLSMSDNTPLISILVPAYNAARYLPEFCQSVQAQTYPHYEVLIGNDGSQDDTAAIAASFLKDSRFRLLQWQPNRGLNAAWAFLLGSMRGEYWCSPGADDVLYPSYLEKNLEILAAKPQACIVHRPAEFINESGGPASKPFRVLNLPRQLEPPRSLQVLLQHNIIHQPSALVRSSVTREVLPFFHWNWAFAPDWFLWILHAATGYDLLWDTEVLHKYRVHSSSLTLAPEKDSLRRAEIRLAPLVALCTAAHLSRPAAVSWNRWGKTLYLRWLRQGLALKARGTLEPEWVQLAAHAYYGASGKPVSFWFEAAKHAVGVVLADLAYERAQRRHSFAVSGLAQANDPIFQ